MVKTSERMLRAFVGMSFSNLSTPAVALIPD